MVLASVALLPVPMVLAIHPQIVIFAVVIVILGRRVDASVGPASA
jgi:hypothetical protein